LLKEEKDINLLFPAAFLVLGIAAAIVMIIYGKAKLSSAEKETQKKEDTLRSYDYVAEKIANYDATKVTYDELVNMFNVGDNWNNDLVNFMNELEERMPKSFQIYAFDVQPEGLTIGVQTEEKADLAKTIEQLRDFTSYQLIDMDKAEEVAYVPVDGEDNGDNEGGNNNNNNANNNENLTDDELYETRKISVILTYTYKPWAGILSQGTEENTETESK
jgi:hypothetical protein